VAVSGTLSLTPRCTAPSRNASSPRRPRIEISVLTPLLPVRPEDVQAGVHGLMIQKGAKRGLLLPQVAVEHGWDRETFLSQVCVKAGLPTDAWKEDAELYSFTAEVFGE
jgi:uncharacterized protein (TIGR00296 family)